MKVHLLIMRRLLYTQWHSFPYPSSTMDDVWNDITTLSSPTTTTNHFQIFLPPPNPPPETPINFLPPPPSTSTMLTLLTPTIPQDPAENRLKPNPLPPTVNNPATSQPKHTEKFRRLMKNREAAARSRARKQARAQELELEVRRLAKENAKLKRLQKEQGSGSHVPKERRLNRTRSAPF